MPVTLPDGSPMPATRAELLRLRAERFDGLSRKVFGMRAALPAYGWMLLGSLGGALLYLGLTEAEGAGVLLLALATACLVAAGAGLAVWSTQKSRLRRARQAWRHVDRWPSARALPAGEIDPGLRTIHDARDDADLRQHCGDVQLRLRQRLNGGDLLGPAMLTVLPGTAGLVCLLGAVTAEDRPGAVGAGVAAVFLLLPSVLLWGVTLREGWRRQQELNVSGLERALYLARRQSIAAEPAAEEPQLPGWARPLAGGLLGIGLLAVLGYVMVRVEMATPLALVVVGIVLVAAGLAVVLAMLPGRRLRVVPLLSGAAGPGATVLSAPSHPVRLRLEGRALEIAGTDTGVHAARVPVSDVLTVVPVQLGYPFAPPAVGLVTDDTPIVLAGAGVRDHDAVRALERAVAATA